MPNKYTSKPLSLVSQTKKSVKGLTGKSKAETFDRAYLELHGVDTIGATYVGRIFFNNPDADEDTPMTPEHGYAGSFSVFGHGGCGGDPGHCERKTGIKKHDLRPKNKAREGVVLAPITKALRNALKRGEEISFTVVPIILSSTEKSDVEDPIKFKEYDISLRYEKEDGSTKKVPLLKEPQPM